MFHWDDRGCVRSHNNIPPPLNTGLPHQHASWLNPPPALSPLLCANQSVETNGEALPGSEDAAVRGNYGSASGPDRDDTVGKVWRSRQCPEYIGVSGGSYSLGCG
ncbi:hypothetical protein NQZ68_001485 [Dissostichus eleginoides]|nr:hypothetical protein NQZ68_001485 [Dissostichus eleginoides]